jgi:glucoamylase
MKKIQFHKNDGYWNFYPRVFAKDGSFPQNVWVNGKTYWEGFQIDQTGYPVLLFYHIFLRANASEKLQLMNEFGPMVVDALNFIAKNGPWTQEERWEENFGISPSSFSAATAALFTGARLFDDEYGQYLNSTAMSWLTKPYDNIDTWTFTSNGFYGDGQYYLRIAGGDRFDGIWNPNLNISTHVANSNNRFDQRRILDQGFLQLSLLGLKSAADEKIKKTEKVIDDNISVMTPNGRGYYRYSFDAYGENGQGRLWPLLSGEHARYYIERFRAKDLNWNQTLKEINSIIGSMYNFANEGLMIPEQVFETTGEGTGSATPLAWAHAEYIKLLWSKEYKQNVENIFN